MKKTLLIGLVASLLLLGVTGFTSAAPILSVHGSTTATGTFTMSVSGYTIDLVEDWTSAGNLFLEFSGLEAGMHYTVNKHITNNTGLQWTSLANELLDPVGGGDDLRDPTPYPAYIPAGFTTSNDMDGLHFAQTASPSIPRTSTVFSSLLVDELTDARDFLDFYGGTLSIGGTDLISYGLTAASTTQPFLLSQRPNTFSDPVPEPATMLLFGTGLIGLAGLRFRRKKK